MAFNNSMDSVSEFQRFTTDISRLWLIFKRRWKPALITSTAIFTFITILTVLQKPSYEASGKMLWKKRTITSSLTASGREIGELNSVAGTDPIATEIEIMKSLPLVERVIKELNLRDNDGESLEAEVFLQKFLTVSKRRGTDVLEISYKSKSAQEAAAVTNRLMNIYVENGILTDRSQAELTAQFITQQLPSTQANVRKAEEALRLFKEENRIADLNSEKQATSATVADLNRQISDSRTALRRAESRKESIRKQLGLSEKDALFLSAVSQNPEIQDTLTDLQQAERKLTIARNQYSPKHPTRIDLEERVSQFRSLLKRKANDILVAPQVNTAKASNLQMRGTQQALADEMIKLQAEQASLNTQTQSLSAEKLRFEKRILELPKFEQKHRELERQLDAAQVTYETLLKKFQEVRIEANQSQGNARVIEYAAVPKKILLKPILIKLFAGTLLSILMAIVTMLWLEIQDKSIKTVQEAQDFFGYPLLGLIPYFTDNHIKQSPYSEFDRVTPLLVLKKLPFTPISEAYRMLLSNLRFLKSDQRLKTLVMTSSIAGEGKSTVTANLALAMVQQGSRVLLIDADMRRPMQHRIWELPQLKGLSDVLVGDVEVQEALHPVEEKLWVLTAGAHPPNPSALIDSARMSELLHQFSQQYDYVLIDTPPLRAASETRSLGKNADGIVLIARPTVLELPNAAFAKNLLQQTESQILGLIVNGIDTQQEPDSYYYYNTPSDTSSKLSQDLTKAL